MIAHIILDFFIFCGVTYFFTEIIKRRFYNISNQGRYALFIRHIKRHTNKLPKGLSTCILNWNDADVKYARHYFTHAMPKDTFIEQYLYIVFCAGTAAIINIAPVALDEYPMMELVFTGAFIILLFVSAVSRLFFKLEIIATENAISLLTVAEHDEGLIIPAHSKLRQRHHDPLLNGDLVFLAFEKIFRKEKQ